MPNLEEISAQQQAEFDRQGDLLPMPDLTPEQIQQVQGTRNSEAAPWETYGDDFDEKLSPELEEAIKEFSETDPHQNTGSEAQEELARLKEGNDAAAVEYQWLDPSEYAEEGARIGSILHSSQFIGLLIEDCGLTAIYRVHPQPKRLTLVVDTSHGQALPEIACWVQAGFMPEFSICNFDDHGVVLQERLRGWRTCLMQMVLKRMLTQEQVEKVFGEATGPASERYNSFMYSLRRQDCEAYDVQ